MLALWLVSAASKSVNFDSKHLKPGAGLSPAAIADLCPEQRVTSPGDAITLAYLWNVGCFLPECEVTIQQAILPLLPSHSPLSLVQELIQAVGTQAPQSRVSDSLKSHFMPVHPGMPSSLSATTAICTRLV